MYTVEQGLLTDIDEITPTIGRLIDQYAVEPEDIPDEHVFVGEVFSNPLLPGFAKYAVLQSLGYPVTISKLYDSEEDEAADNYMHAACAIYIAEGDEAHRIMIGPEAWPEGEQPPFARLIGKLGAHWGEDILAKYILGERYSYGELCREYRDELDAIVYTEEDIRNGVGDRPHGFILEIKEADRLSDAELLAAWEELVPELRLPDGTHDAAAAEDLYKRAFMAQVLATMTDEERYGIGLRYAVLELYQVGENWDLYDKLRAQGVRPLGYEEIYGIITSQIKFARDKLAVGIVPGVEGEFLI